MKQVEITSKVVGRGGSTTSASPSLDLSGYALISDLLNYVTINGNEDVTGLHDFVNGLKIGGIELIQKNGNAFLKGSLVVEGGITMYGDGEGGSSVPSYSTLGSLLNVDESNDAVASVDRVLFQSAGSNVWSWKALSEIGGGSSGGSVSGNYLPLSGGTLKGNTQYTLNLDTTNTTEIWETLYLNGEQKAGLYYSIRNNVGLYSYVSNSYMGMKNDGSPYIRIGNNWNTILHSGNIANYNAGSATKLQTARTIWGQSFDGTGNVSGNILLGVGSDYAIGTGYSSSDKRTFNNITIGNSTSGIVYNGGTWTGSTSFNAHTFTTGAYSNALVINNGGNVGIGTTNPYTKLHVEGDFKTNDVWIGSDTGTYIEGTQTGGLRIQYANSDKKYTQIHLKDLTVTINNNLLCSGGITMYSDQRKKTILNHVELSLRQIANAPLIEHYYNSDESKTTHVGSIAQYWAEMNDWFCKLDNEGYYTMEIQNCALASAISIARHLEKYESKTDKKIRMLKKRITELEDKLERLEGGKYGCN